jgi:hypothetical protein
MAQQLCMSLRGNAQKLLSDLNAKQISQYSDIKSSLEQRFHPPGQESALEIIGEIKMSLSPITDMHFVG